MTRFAAIGHVTHDRLEAGLFPGGSALYAALTAAGLGATARIVTSCGPDFIGRQLLADAGVQLQIIASEHTTCFEERYRDGRRVARVLHQAKVLRAPLPEADVILVCPVIGEIGLEALVPPPGALLGAGLQGWTRRLDENGFVFPRPLENPALFSNCRAVFCSDEDLGDFSKSAVESLLRTVALVVVTQGRHGALLYQNGACHRIRACPADEVDPTGAGDAFAASFLLALASGESPVRAAANAACAAAIAIEAPGPEGLTCLARFQDRLARYQQSDD